MDVIVRALIFFVVMTLNLNFAVAANSPAENFWRSAYMQLATSDCAIRDLGSFGSTGKLFQIYVSPQTDEVLIQMRSATQTPGTLSSAMIVKATSRKSTRVPKLTVSAVVPMPSPEGPQLLEISILNTLSVDTNHSANHSGVFRVSKDGHVLAESPYNCD